MANFPALEPSGRIFAPGDRPQFLHSSSSGVAVRFLQGSDLVQQRLELRYEYLTESEAKQILDHFTDQQGSLISFDLPSIIWSGYTTPPVSSSDYQWRYAGPFEVNIAAPSLYNVTVQLLTIPI